MAEVISLAHPVKAHGKELAELTLRRPTGRDMRVCGQVYKLTTDGEIAVQAQAMHRMIAELAGVPPSAVDLLDAADWNAASAVVLGFIMAAETKTPPQTEPTEPA